MEDVRDDADSEQLHFWAKDWNASAAPKKSPMKRPASRQRWRLGSKENPAMQNMTAVEVKAFVPSKDFSLSKRFYQDLGFNLGWSSDELAYLHHGNSSFLLQNFYVKEHADNFMMHLLVENVEAWWGHVQDTGLAAKYHVKVDPPEDRPWGIRDFVLVDPTGVLWRIGQTSQIRIW
jgi:catechol 2,3-dioxygenase-like lactoylglutathione lyase family enzyme